MSTDLILIGYSGHTYVCAEIVLLNDYDTAYRRELGEEDHAEYTLIDKKNKDKELSDCWLFATIEPCAPSSRNFPKLSCSERIVNARISEVWFGIEDKNPTNYHSRHPIESERRF